MNPHPCRSLRLLSRFITNHNPFYLISVMFVLYGLTQISTASGSVTTAWLLMSLLCGYTMLMGLTGWAIVRFGQVWDDARTILLVIVLLVLALSNCFDEVALKNPIAGAAFLLAGLAFSIGVVEGLLGALAMRLSPLVRAPFYSALALLFVYPIWLSLLSVHGYETAMVWAVYLFPWLSSVVLLTLVPAASARDERPNGTPWSWPLYPWSMIVVLIVGVTFRSYSLSMAFEPTRGTAISWQAYFLAPLLAASCALLLELALTGKSRRAKLVAMIAPLALVPLSLPGAGRNMVEARFLAMLQELAGSPVQISLSMLLAFYAIAWLRGLRAGEAGALVSLLLLGLVDERTVDLRSLRGPDVFSLEAIAVLQIASGLWSNRSWRMIAAIVTGVAALCIRGEGTWFTAANGFYPLHLTLLLVLFVAIFFDDATARTLRRALWAIVPCAALLAALSYDWLFPQAPVVVQLAYIATLTVGSALCWHLDRLMPQFVALLVSLLANGVAQIRQLYLVVAGSELQRAVPYLAWGIVFLGFAAAISLYKGGIAQRLWTMLRRLNQALATRTPA